MQDVPKVLYDFYSYKIMDSVQVRDELIDELRKYMIGPHWGNDEEIDTVPKFTYMTGIIYPQDSEVEQENLPTEDHGEKEDEVPDMTSINALNLSSFGLTCMLDAQTEEIKINVDYGIYKSKKIVHEDRNKTLYQRNHFEQTELQLSRDCRKLPTMKINPEVKSIFDFTIDDFELVDYEFHPHIKGKVAV